MPKGKDKRKFLSRRRQRSVTEVLESRVLLSGAHEQDVINALEVALQPGGSTLLSFNTRLTGSTALGQNIAVVGTGMSGYDPGAALANNLKQITGTYTYLGALAAALSGETGVSVSATRDLVNDVEIDVTFNVTSTVTVPLSASFGITASDPGTVTMSVNLQESLTIGAYWDTHSSSAQAYINASSAAIQVSGTATGFTYAAYPAEGQLGFLEFDTPNTPTYPATDPNTTGSKFLSTVVAFTPIFNFTLNTQQPIDATENAGRLTMSQLNSTDVGNLVNTQISQGANSTVTINLTTPLSTSANQVVFTWPQVTSSSIVSSTLTSNPNLANLNALQSVSAQAISLGLDEVTGDLSMEPTNTAANNPFTQTLPIIGESINQLVTWTGIYSTLTGVTDPAPNPSGSVSLPYSTDEQLISQLGAKSVVLSESANGGQLLFALSTSTFFNSTFTPTTAGASPALTLGGVVYPLTTYVMTQFTFGVDGNTSHFFVKAGGPDVTVEVDFAKSLTEPQGNPDQYSFGALLGNFLSVDMGNSTFNLAATGTITLVDPQTDNPATPGILTDSELANGPQSDGTDPADPATLALSGTAALALDLRPDFTYTQTGIAPQASPATFTYTWGNLATPSTYTESSSGATSYYTGFNSLSSSGLVAAIQELPTLLNAVSDSTMLGSNLSFLGPDLGSTIALGSKFSTEVTNSGILNGYANFQYLVKDLQIGFGSASVNANLTSDGFELLFDVPQTYNGQFSWQISHPLNGAQLQATGTAPGSVSYLGVVSLDVVLSAAGDAFYLGSDTQVSASVLINATGLSGTATVGNLSVNYSGGSAEVEATSSGTLEPGVPATITIGTPGAARVALPATIVKPDEFFGAMQFSGAARLTLPFNTLPNSTNPKVQFDWSNLGSPSSMVVTPTGVGSLTSTTSFATTPLTNGLNGLLSIINDWENSSVLNTNIPFVNKTIEQLVDFVGTTKNAFSQIEAQVSAGTSPTDLNNKILSASLPSGMTLTATSNDNPGSNTFEYKLSINEGPNLSYPFSLGAGQSFFSINTTVNVSAGFTGNITFGFDPSDGFYIVGNSNASSPMISLSGNLSVNFAKFLQGSFGPLAFGISSGSATASLGLALNLVPPGDNGNKISTLDLTSNGLSIIQSTVNSGMGQVNLAFGAHLGTNGPGITGTFSASWDPTRDTPLEFGPSNSTDPTDGFGPISFDLGEFVNSLVGPVLNEIKKYDPLPSEVTDALNYKIPVIDMTPADILADYLDEPDFATLLQIAGLVTDVANLPGVGSDAMDLSNYFSGSPSTGDTGTPDGTAPSGSNTGGDDGSDYSAFSSFASTLQSDYDISLPFLQNPQQSLIDTLLGKPVDLIDFDPGHVSISASYETPKISFPLFSIGVASANAFFSAGISATLFANIDIGLSTRGILGQGLDGAGAIQDGFYIGDSDAMQAGVELEGHVTIGGEVDLFGFLSIASLSGSLGPYGEIGARVNSLVPNNSGGYVFDPSGDGLYEIAGYNGAPAGNGRAYLDEIEYIADNYGPLCAVMPVGQIGLQLSLNASIGLGPLSYSFNILTQQFPIANFDYPCEPQAANLAYVSGNQLIMYTQGTVGGKNIDETAGYTISSSVQYDSTTGNPDGIVIVESNSSNIYYQDFPISALSGVNTVVLEGSNGNDTFNFDGKLSEAGILPTPVQYLSIFTNQGNDVADLSALNTSDSNLLGTTIHGGNGNDTLKGTYASDTIYVGSGTNYVFSGTSTGLVYETSGTDTVSGGNGNVTVYAGSGKEQILLGDGNDIVYAGSGNEEIDLGSGEDLVTSGTGEDTIEVGDGEDKIYGDSGGSTITTGAGQDIIYGGAGNDSITAGGGNDFIDPGTGTDYVDGGTGRTTLATHVDSNQTLTNTYVDFGSQGRVHFTDISDLSLNGGPGNESFDVSSWSGGPVQVNGGGGSDTIVDNADVNFTLSDTSLALSTGETFALSGIGNASLTGGGSDDTFDVSGWNGSATLTGNGGTDTLLDNDLRGATLSDSLLTRTGQGSLTLSGIVQANLSTYSFGAVKIDASAFDGAVAIYAQGSNNTLIGGTGSDYLFAGSGTNNTLTAKGTSSNQVLGGAGSHDILAAGPGQNLINGSTGGFDTITTAGTSHVYTPGGNETISAQSGGATIYAFGSGDTINNGSATNNVTVHPGDAGTVASDFVAPTSGDPWALPTLPPATTSTLPTGPNSSGQWIQYAASASGGGVSNSSATAIEPSVAVDNSDNEYIAWADNRTGVYEIYVAEHTASGWVQLASSAQGGGISNSSGNATQPDITLNSSGYPEVAWAEASGSSTDIYAAVFNGTSWQAMGTSLSAGGLSNTGAATSPQIVSTSSGAVVAWLNTNGAATNVYARQFNGSSWATLGSNSASGNGISNQSATTPGFALATDGSKIAVDWTEVGTGAGNSIYLEQYTGGAWSALNGSASSNGISGTFSAQQPTIAYASGSLYAAWAANTDGTYNIVAAANGGSGWNNISIQTPASAGVNQVSRGTASNPQLSGNGNSLSLVWLEDRLSDTPDQAVAIYANRLVSGSFVYQLPGDSSFDGILGRSTSLSQPASLALAVDSSGHPFVTWGDDSSGSAQIYSLADTLNVNKIIYVNDSLSVTDFYTTAGGSDSNSGLTPDKPLATLGAALALATQAGDVILIDGGSFGGATLSSANNGVLILGSPAGNTQITQMIALNGVSNVTLASLDLTAGVSVINGSGNDLINDVGGTPQQLSAGVGGSVSIDGASNLLLLDDSFAGLTAIDSTSGLTVLASSILGSGITISGPASSLLIKNSTLTSLKLNAASQGTISKNNINKNGLAINATFTGSIDHNFIHGASVGVTYAASAPLASNEIFANKTGVTDTVSSNTAGLGFAAGSAPNFIFDNTTGVNLVGLMQDQSITANQLGVTGSGTLGGTDLNYANYIENNIAGVKFTGTVQYNVIANNATSFLVTNGELIEHNLIYGTSAAPNVETNGASNVEIVNNTFYTTGQNNIQIDNASSDVEVLNNVLWATAGYDLYIADNSRSGFFSDYNDLYTTGSGLIVHYLEDFSDLLDWQDDVALYDLHSIGTTVVNPTGAQPQFVDLPIGDFTVYPATAGIRATSPTVGTGDPATDLGLPTGEQNLLSNSSFESGTTGWTVNPGGGTQSSNPAAFNGSSYFFAGSVAAGYAQQTINLATAGYTASQIDAGTLDISFGGRIRTANETVPDQGEITLTFQNGSGQTIGTSTVLLASNVNDRWELVSGRVHIPSGARSVVYEYQSTRETGSTDDNYLDGAFLYVLPNNVSTDIGAFGNTSASLANPVDQSIHLVSPNLYVNWTLNQTHAITWETFGNTGNAPVEIDLYHMVAGSLVFYKNIVASTPDTGSYAWIPANTSGLTYGLTGLVIEVSLVGNSPIHDQSTETFAIPANGNTFYINDNSTTGDQYTTAKGNNRATGLTLADPLPLLTNLFRTYSLGATSIVYVDNGTYADFSAVEISGNPAIGSGQGVTILGPTNNGTQATISALGFTSPAVIDVNDASYVTLKNLALTGANYGLWIHNASPNFVGSYLIAMSNLLGGIRLESDSANATFDHLTTTNNSGDGFYAGGNFISLTHSTSSNNTSNGFNLANSGNAVLTNDAGFSNGVDGLAVQNSTSGSTAIVGNTNLALGLGNQFYNNSQYGIYVSGGATIAGNVVYNQTTTNYDGIVLNSGGNLATENIVYNNYNGIVGNTSTLSYNTVYNNLNVGIEADGGGTITGNTVYGNFIGIRSSTAPNSASGPFILNNLVYNNTAVYPQLSSLPKGQNPPPNEGIWLIGGNAAQIYNNTVYQPIGIALNLDAYGSVNASNLKVENNILWTQNGDDLSIASTSETGLHSDFNDLYYTASGAAGVWEGNTQATLANWITASNQDTDSISIDPLFVSVANGDFHLQSINGSVKGGTLSPILSGGLPVANPGTLTAQANESPAIDRGDNTFAYSNEPTPNGGFINLGFEGNTTQASLSPVSYVLVLKPGAGNTVIENQPYTITWRSQDTSGTVNIDLLYSGSEYLNIATGVSNNGSYSWTPGTSITPNSNYTIQITRNAAPTAVGSSQPFSIGAPINNFYVNDASSGGVFTTAAGNDANSGLDPAHPKATIQALLSAYTLGAGDTIYIDQGTYNLSNNLVLTSVNSGLTIIGAPNDATILDRTNTGTGAYVFDLQAVSNLTLNSFTFTGGYYGINAAFTTASDLNITIENSTFTADQQDGLFLVNNYTNSYVTTGDVIKNNVFHDMIASVGNNYYGYGLQDQGDQISVINNTFYNLGTGLSFNSGDGSTVTGNTAHNTTTGFTLDNCIASGNIAYTNSTGFLIYTSTSVVTGNTAHDNTSLGFNLSAGTLTGNIAYNNPTGIQVGGATASDNLVYNNTNYGITGGNSSNILGNVAYGNGIGIGISSAGNAAATGPIIENNLVYSSKTAGISEVGGDHTPIVNNTIYATTGDALDISGSNITDVEVRDNIFFVTSGLDINVASASEQSVTIDYNDLYATGSGQTGQWNGVNYATLATWQNASGMDKDSISTDPLFENIAGNDFHVQSQYGANHGGTLAPILGGNGLPAANPGTLSNDSVTSPTLNRGAATDPYGLEPAPNGGYVDLGAYGNTSQSSISPANYLFVINPAANITIATGQPTTITWRDEVSNLAAGATDTDTFELLQGSNVILTFTGHDTGSYAWTPPTTLPGGIYSIEIIRTDATGLTATSSPFNIQAFTGTYYVNGSASAGVYTTAAGNDSNSGLDPAHPKATIGAILNSYTMQPGNIIMVDSGTYNLSTNLVLTAADSGITIEGVPNQTTLNRGNLNSGADVLLLQNATNLTLENLNITGGYYGIDDTYQDSSAGLTVTGCNFYGDENYGVYLEGFNGASTFTGNTFHDMLNGGYTTYGLYLSYAGNATATNNTAYNLSYGIDISTQNGTNSTGNVSSNIIYDCNYGISVGQSNNGLFTITNNTLYDNFIDNLNISGATITASSNTVYEDGAVASKESSSQTGINVSYSVATNNNVYGNVIGVNVAGSTTLAGNNIHNNTQVGVSAQSGSTTTGNTIYSNGTWGIAGSPATVNNNVIYGNTSGGIYIYGDYNASVLNNTVYQTTGPALRIDGLTQNGSTLPAMMVQNNIFWATSAPDLLINDTGEQSFTTGSDSDYNDLYSTGTGEVAQISGTDFTSLSAWAVETGLDVHSISADPQFVNVTSSNFHVLSTSPTIDQGNPTFEFILEPQPNGGRLNLGSDGDTVNATTSASTSVNVITPTAQQKLQVGVPTTIQWVSDGLLSSQTVTEVATGKTTAVGEYHATEFGTGGINIQPGSPTINTSLVTNPAPLAVYQSFAYANSGVGVTMGYQIPVPNGTYTIRLDFSEPYYTTTGSRVFDILLNGTTVQSAFDIAKTAGNVTNKAVAETYTVTATGGTGISLLLKNDTSTPALINGFEVSYVNAGGSANSTANVQVSLNNGTSWSTVATNQPMDSEGRGSYVWIPTAQTAGATALVRVVANNGISTTGSSGAFSISPDGVIYYVNDNSTTGDSLTTAVGNNANDGKTPATPMASVEAVLHTYQPGAGAIIEVDNGTYTLFDTIYLSTLDSGVTITGPTTGAAVVNRNNNNDLVFNLLDGANNLTITNLSITGGSTGINTDEVSLGNANITIANNIIYANTGSGYSGGIYAYNGSNWIVTGNTVHDNPGFYGGIYLQNSTGTVSNNIVYNERYDIYLSAPSNAPLSNVVSGNTVYGASYGIDVDNATVKNNIVHDNTVYGIYADTGSFITGNSVYRQTTSGAYGIEMSTATANNNTVYDNYIGIYTTGGGAHIYGNRVYSNLDDGLSLNNLSGTNSGGGYNYVATVYDNLIYANAQTGIYLTGDQDLTLLNNTIYQLAGDAIEFGSANTTYPTTVENNIIWVQAGYDLRLDSGVAAASVVSDYNDLYHTGANAKVGLLSGTAYSTLAAWQTASSKDAHSTEANPNFVDPTGADAVLGYNNSTAYNGGPDDDFFLLAGSPAIGAGNLAVRPATDALGYPWNTTDLGAFAYRAAASAATTPATVTSLVPGAGPGGLGIDTITVTFSQPVNDVDANAPSLYSLISAGPDGIFGTSDDISYPLTPAYTAGSQQVVLSVAGGTLSPGQYQLTIFSNSASSIHNLAGLELDGDNNGTPGGNYVTIITVSPSVVGRYVFYNDSSFDGNNVAANSADDAAIATDKQALLPGNNATFANYTSYSNGINGIMIDILGLPSTSLGIADFSFLVDSSATPTTWTSAPTPQSITVRPGAGVGGSSRVEIIWANGVIADQWLQVTVNADAKTGLSQADVFYFGNAIGDSGNSTTDAAVTIADALAARGRTSANSVSVTSPYDYNRDGLVNGADVAIAQQNLTSGSTVLPLISAPSVSQAIVESVIDPSTPDNDASPTTAIITDPSTSSIDTDNNSSAPVDFVSSPTDGTGSSSDDSGDILYIGGNPGFNESDPVTPTVPFITTTILSDSSASQNTTYDSSSDSDTSTPRSTNDDSTSQTTNTTAPIETPVVIVDPVQGFHLVIVGPTSGIAGKKLGKFTIFAEDAANNILKSANTQVSLSLDVGTLAGHTTRALHHGKAVFSHLSINDSGSYSINASDDIYTSATDSILITARAHRNARMRHHS